MAWWRSILYLIVHHHAVSATFPTEPVGKFIVRFMRIAIRGESPGRQDDTVFVGRRGGRTQRDHTLHAILSRLPHGKKIPRRDSMMQNVAVLVNWGVDVGLVELWL